MRPEGFDPEDGDEGVDLCLDDEPGALLVFLNDRCKRVTKSLYWTLRRLPRCIELGLLDFLTFQLDGELISHNVRVSTLKERVSRLLLELIGVRKEMEELRKDKATLEVRLLGRLEELKKALDDIFRL